mmetsp:Transcript_34995/g.81179  ORF Transcript_34995/g.81179 Transcript_34995/m.81179 type:complete len:161 (-) Transcript_34995:197-679(-)
MAFVVVLVVTVVNVTVVTVTVVKVIVVTVTVVRVVVVGAKEVVVAVVVVRVIVALGVGCRTRGGSRVGTIRGAIATSALAGLVVVVVVAALFQKVRSPGKPDMTPGFLIFMYSEGASILRVHVSLLLCQDQEVHPKSWEHKSQHKVGSCTSETILKTPAV